MTSDDTRHLHPPANTSGIRRLITVHRQVGNGLTQEVASVLQYRPTTAFTLRAMMQTIRPGAIRGEVQSILHKLVHDKGAVVTLRETVEWGANGGGARVVKAYRWRLPSDRPGPDGGV